MYRWVAMGTILASLGASSAQTSDDLKCYKMKDPLKLAGTVALDTQPFGADPGCKVSSAKSAKLFCVPATESNAAFITGKKQPLTPVPVFGSDPGDRICYKVKCDGTAADQQVTDQFGTRTVENLKSALLCVPAVQGGRPPRLVDNGDGTVTDHETGLQWEKKVGGSVFRHDVSNTSTLVNTLPGPTTPLPLLDGTAYSMFLRDLKMYCGDASPGGCPCFAGHCDCGYPHTKSC